MLPCVQCVACAPYALANWLSLRNAEGGGGEHSAGSSKDLLGETREAERRERGAIDQPFSYARTGGYTKLRRALRFDRGGGGQGKTWASQGELTKVSFRWLCIRKSQGYTLTPKQV